MGRRVLQLQRVHALFRGSGRRLRRRLRPAPRTRCNGSPSRITSTYLSVVLGQPLRLGAEPAAAFGRGQRPQRLSQLLLCRPGPPPAAKPSRGCSRPSKSAPWSRPWPCSPTPAIPSTSYSAFRTRRTAHNCITPWAFGVRLGASKSVQKLVNHVNLSWPIGEKRSSGPGSASGSRQVFRSGPIRAHSPDPQARDRTAFLAILFLSDFASAAAPRFYQPPPGLHIRQGPSRGFPRRRPHHPPRSQGRLRRLRGPYGSRTQVFAFGNRIHIDSRETTVRRRLLVPRGRGSHAGPARRNRARAPLRGIPVRRHHRGTGPVDSGRCDVTVTTFDQWTTVPGAGVQGAGPQGFGRVHGPLGQDPGRRMVLVAGSVRDQSLRHRHARGRGPQARSHPRHPLPGLHQQQSHLPEPAGFRRTMPGFPTGIPWCSRSTVRCSRAPTVTRTAPRSPPRRMPSSTISTPTAWTNFPTTWPRRSPTIARRPCAYSIAWPPRKSPSRPCGPSGRTSSSTSAPPSPSGIATTTAAWASPTPRRCLTFPSPPRPLRPTPASTPWPARPSACIEYAYRTARNFRNLKWSESVETGWRLTAKAAMNQEWLGAGDADFRLSQEAQYTGFWRDMAYLNSGPAGKPSCPRTGISPTARRTCGGRPPCWSTG